MSNFWQDLIINLGGNAVLGGLIIYLGKIYLERIGRNEQATIDERLKRLEQDHEKLLTKDEHFHQISQQTYQKMFEKKVDAYMRLIQLRQQYLSNKEVNIPKENVENYQGKDLISILSMKEVMEENRFYLSSDLIELFDQWYEEAYHYIVASKEDAFNQALETFKWNEAERYFLNHTIQEASTKQLNLMLKETNNIIGKIFETIDIDVQNLKKKYNI
ncbi:hypothetical protein ACTXJ5_10810 [Psychrobacter alimentarius]|uniref:hypothetical protein n=1 Tax=Psychrobacter alimentarius TaxID=261164 RepID=UPI003FD356CE